MAYCETLDDNLLLNDFILPFRLVGLVMLSWYGLRSTFSSNLQVHGVDFSAVPRTFIRGKVVERASSGYGS